MFVAEKVLLLLMIFLTAHVYSFEKYFRSANFHHFQKMSIIVFATKQMEFSILCFLLVLISQLFITLYFPSLSLIFLHSNLNFDWLHDIYCSHYYTLAVFAGAQRWFQNREWTRLSATKHRHISGWMPPRATKRQQWRRPYGSFGMFKTSTIERQQYMWP